MGADPPDRDGVTRVLAVATEVLRRHTPDRDGWCTGCLAQWGRLAPYPCHSAEWASAVRTAYRQPPD